MTNKVTGKINCKECDKEIEWYYIYAGPSRQGLHEVHILDKNKVGARLLSGKFDKKPHEFSLYCPEDDCGVYNIFKHPETKTDNNE
ncbi:hypothetical protein [Bacillus mycoides]|uniref:hypothetical protein n=1 Tax=Bacillus mycoides TaxID=1405 RepID=UPI0011AA1893|nr:hypothetical protein [Bacillus mycoides]